MNDDPKQIDTFEKIIKSIKEELHKYIDNPNNETASALYPAMGSIPYKYIEYEFWNDKISEVREYMSMLFQLFGDYFQQFIKDGLEYDKIVKGER
ncbi:MAG TPA: hypothetical protein VGB37_00385 [Candidatus Lokiarchaeia archaeon]